MKKSSVLMYTILPVLVLSSIVAVQVYKPSAGSVENQRPIIGMGDLHSIEAQQVIPNTGTSESISQFTGFGDYQRYERFLERPQTILDPRAVESAHTYAGTGDSPRFSARQTTPNTGSKGINGNYAGTEKFHRIEAEQSTQK